MRSLFLLLVSVSSLFAQTPEIESVRSAATNLASAIVPQMLVSIFGTNLAAQSVSANGFPLPMQIAGTSVTFNRIAAPLLYVSPNQINVQAPSSVEGLASASIQVTTASGTSAPFTVAINAWRAPGIFTADATGCGQAAAFNVRADGSLSPNTSANSYDPLKDQGVTFFGTGLGPFSDRADGTAWQSNPVDNISIQSGAITGYLGHGFTGDTVSLAVSYAGPARGTAGVDQLTAASFQKLDPTHTVILPVPEGCAVPVSFSTSGAGDVQSPPVNVSIHSGGGVCVDPPATSLGTVTWSQTATSDSDGVSSESSVEIRFLKGSNIVGFERPPVTSVASADIYGYLRPSPSICAASYPATQNAGTISVGGPELGPLSLEPQNQNGVLIYQASLPSTALGAGAYSVKAEGGPDLGAFAAQATLPPPITITNNLKPGTTIHLPFTLNWTGGGPESVVTARLLAQVPEGPTRLLEATSPATDGARPLPLPAGGPYQFPVGTEVELIVTQQPAAAPANPFTAPGLTFGGEQKWLYVFDFKGLKSD